MFNKTHGYETVTETCKTWGGFGPWWSKAKSRKECKTGLEKRKYFIVLIVTCEFLSSCFDFMRPDYLGA